jgi:transposase-like protein
MAATRKAFDAFLAAYTLKFEKASACLEKDRQALLAFYDFPTEHWKHLRTSNPIESTFARVRHRTMGLNSIRPSFNPKSPSELRSHSS